MTPFQAFLVGCICGGIFVAAAILALGAMARKNTYRMPPVRNHR